MPNIAIDKAVVGWHQNGGTITTITDTTTCITGSASSEPTHIKDGIEVVVLVVVVFYILPVAVKMGDPWLKPPFFFPVSFYLCLDDFHMRVCGMGMRTRNGIWRGLIVNLRVMLIVTVMRSVIIP